MTAKLKNAPLLEVIFEISWEMKEEDWMQYPYLHGDMYERLKDTYSRRELLFPPDILPRQFLKGRVQYRFKSKEHYPLYQLGPGILTYNTTEDEYEWHNYKNEISRLLDCFFDVNGITTNEYSPTLSYYDFLKLDLEDKDVMEYVSDNLNISIDQNIMKFDNNPSDFIFGCSYKVEVGILNFKINSGMKDKDNHGLILEIQVKCSEKFQTKLEIIDWLNTAHELTSSFFRQLTRGTLYESFTE